MNILDTTLDRQILLIKSPDTETHQYMTEANLK